MGSLSLALSHMNSTVICHKIEADEHLTLCDVCQLAAMMISYDTTADDTVDVVELKAHRLIGCWKCSLRSSKCCGKYHEVYKRLFELKSRTDH